MMLLMQPWAWNNFGAENKTELADYSYNCHGYAWTLGNSVFMDMGVVNAFWEPNTGGYIRTYDPSDPDIKIVMYGASHSAMKWGSKYRSKWNTDHQVFEHYLNNLPSEFGTPTHYYKLAKYDVTFNANGGTGSLPSDKLNVEAGSPASILSSAPTPTPTLNGLSTVGWATSSPGTPISFSVPYRITSTQTLYALYATGSITGSSTVHYSGEGYTLNSVLPTGGTITWEVSPGNLFSVSPSTGSSTKIMKSSNTSSGQVTLTAKVNGVVVETKTLTAYSVGMSGPSTLYSGGYASFGVTYGEGATYSWSGGFIEVVSGGDTRGATFYVPNGGPPYGYAFCTVTNNGVNTYLSLSVPIY
jgi:Listeria-Bacteroides repeat domain (List_Bact_rpt)